MADVVVKIDADTAAYIAKLSQMAKAHEKVTDKVKETNTEADNSFKTFAKGVAVVTALAAAANTMASAYREAGKAAAGLNKSFGSGALNIGTSLGVLGYTQKQANQIIPGIQGGTAGATVEQNTAFLSTMAQEQLNRRQRVFGGKQLDLPRPIVQQAMNLYQQYGDRVFGPGGSRLSQLLEMNSPYSHNVSAFNKRALEMVKESGENPEGIFKDENAVRQYEEKTKYAGYQETYEKGMNYRAGEAYREYNALTKPGRQGLQTIAEWLPFERNEYERRSNQIARDQMNGRLNTDTSQKDFGITDYLIPWVRGASREAAKTPDGHWMGIDEFRKVLEYNARNKIDLQGKNGK